MIDTFPSNDLETSKHSSKSKVSYVVGEEVETTRKPLEEPDAEYDEDFDGKLKLLQLSLSSATKSICSQRNPATFHRPFRVDLEDFEQFESHKKNRQIRWLRELCQISRMGPGETERPATLFKTQKVRVSRTQPADWRSRG